MCQQPSFLFFPRTQQPGGQKADSWLHGTQIQLNWNTYIFHVFLNFTSFKRRKTCSSAFRNSPIMFNICCAFEKLFCIQGAPFSTLWAPLSNPSFKPSLSLSCLPLPVALTSCLSLLMDLSTSDLFQGRNLMFRVPTMYQALWIVVMSAASLIFPTTEGWYYPYSYRRGS